jgi:penicillin-binding protein-related factor A (putative recombinase)
MNKVNKGKAFENAFKSSCQKQGIFCTRLRDNQITYTTEEKTYQQPYDYEVYSFPYLMCCELKATHLPSVSFEREKKQKVKKMLHYHQIEGLEKASQHNGVFGLLIFDFQTSGVTYALTIEKFLEFFHSSNKQSISEKEVIALSPIVVNKKLLRTNYDYDVEGIFKELDKIYHTISLQ